MIRSLYSGVSGLKSHQTLMDVIGNNIANVNTPGFKSSRVLFKDVYYQTMSDASEATEDTGGRNPMQIGYGSAVSAIQVTNTRSGYQQTGRTLDTYISGNGFFTVQNASGDKFYTRVGALDFDAEGNLIDANGNFVLGYTGTTGGGGGGTLGEPKEIKIADFSNYIDVSIGPDGKITGKDAKTKEIKELGQVGLAVFNNPNGLSQEGMQYFAQTANSGDPTYTTPGSELGGELVAGGLESSNVDLTKEFSDMIVAQRGFQATSRVVTTSDQILEELVNLKR